MPKCSELTTSEAQCLISLIMQEVEERRLSDLEPRLPAPAEMTEILF